MANEYKIKISAEKANVKSPSIPKAGGGLGIFQTLKKQAKDIGQAGFQLPSGLKSIFSKLISSNKDLVGSNSKLAKSNEKSASAIGKVANAVKGIGKGIGGGIKQAAQGGIGAGVSRIGASLPIAGVALGITGFAMQQISKVGNAYMNLVSQQKGTVGISGGLQRGRGIYLGAEMGAGMKAYGMATGRFQKKGAAFTPSMRQALDVGAIYGLSSEEALQTAGQFQRATGEKGVYQQAAQIGAGMGIESELNMMLQGMAGIMTDAVKEGINASNLSSDMARDIGTIVQATPQKSVEAAMNIVKSFQSVTKQVARGKMGTAEGLYATKATQQLLTERITGEKGYLERLVSEGTISERQAQRLGALKKGATFADVMKAAPKAAYFLTRKMAAETSPAKIQKRVMKNIKSIWGDDPEGMQLFADFASTQGWSLSDSQIQSMWKTDTITGKGIKAKGAEILKQKAGEVKKGAVAKGIGLQQLKEETLIKYGNTFAKMTVSMEETMTKAAGAMGKEIIALTTAIGEKGMRGATDYFSNKVEEAATMLFNMIKDAVNPFSSSKKPKLKKNK